MKYAVIYIAILLFSICACKKEGEDPGPSGPVTNQEINKWITDSMRTYYLWSSQVPLAPDLNKAPADFFASIKNPADLYSRLIDPNNPPKKTLFNRFGFDIAVISFTAGVNGVACVVKLVADPSPAFALGIKRGTFITKLDNTVISSSNAASLFTTLITRGNGSLTLAKLNTTSGAIEETGTVSISSAFISENPIYTSRVYTRNGVKAGYFFYNSFNEEFNNELLAVFQDFKAQQVTELILDMRYNEGGSVAAAGFLSSFIPAGITANSAFLKLTGNASLGMRNLSFSETAAQSTQGGSPGIATALASNLGLQRVFILTSQQTASAAEIVINCLKPYVRVIQIGETTFGKDKATVQTEDKRNPKRIGLLLNLVAYKLSNSSGEGDYTTGIPARHIVDEFSLLPLRSVGSNEDPLISKALSFVPDPASGKVSDGQTSGIHTRIYNPVMGSDIFLK
jgi:carboxyl-terminal processing protease